MARKQAASKKIKKKRWFPVNAPKMFGGRAIGESYLTESIEMKGRFMNMNLSNILNDPKKQNTNVQLLISQVKDGQGFTQVIKFERINSFMKRMVRRGRNKVEDSFLLKTSDGKKTRIKTIIITNNYVPKSVETNLRHTAKALLKEVVSKNTFEKSFEDMLKGSVQKEIKGKLSKVTPIRTFEVRVFKLEVKSADEIEVVDQTVVEEVKEETQEVTEEKVEEKKPVKKEKKTEEKKPKKTTKKAKAE